MIKNKLLSDVSISTGQAMLNQLSGVIVFLIISTHLAKSDLGYINWALAVLLVVFSVMGLGLEQVAVKKAATGTVPETILRYYFFHVLFTGILFITVLLLIQNISNGSKVNRQLFLLLAISQCLSFFAVPFRQIANGLEKFSVLFMMSSCANIIKITGIVILSFTGRVSLLHIIYLYLLASFIELSCCIFLYRMQLSLPITFGYDRKKYLALIKEALPQLGITIFNTAVQRLDWILLGLLSTTVMVAEYSFTNKLFELAMLPLLIAAPVIFPKIAKLFNTPTCLVNEGKISYLKTLVRLEIIVAVFVALLVNSCWKEVVDPLTDNKYGSSTRELIFIMSFAMPLIYLNNLFWSILFSQGKMRQLFFIFLCTFLANMTTDLLLIPFFHAKGAALGFVTALCIQSVLYFQKVRIKEVKKAVVHLLPVLLSALLAGFFSFLVFEFFVWRSLAASFFYFFFLIILKQLRPEDWQLVKKMAVIS